jgi:alpha-galactosidase
MNSVWEWEPEVGGNLWRTTGDIKDTYERMSLIGFAQAGLAKYAGPGHWNDSDMLEVGNGGMNGDEYRTHMSLWAMLTAPLLAGNDLSKMNPETLAILENRDVIAIDQDRLGIQGDRLSAVGPLEIWSKPLSDGSKAVALFNRGELETSMTLKLSNVDLKKAVNLHDVWAGKDITVENGIYTAVVPKHGVVLLRIQNSSHLNIH